MKLLNRSLLHLSISILVIVSIWSVVFYFNMLDEIYDSIDDGLDNYKLLIINKTETDSSVLNKISFDESNYAIREIGRQSAVKINDIYQDTLMYMYNEDDLEPVRMLTTAFRHNGHFYELRVISSMVEEDDLIESLIWSICWLYLALVFAIIIINNVVFQKLWKPFYSLLFQLKTFRLDKNEKLPDLVTRTKEFNELKNAANALIKHSLEAYNNQKQFTENAAHELQTPLAIATSKLELLLESENLEVSNAKTIAEVLEIIERLSRLNKSLLLLSRIENKQFFDNQDISIHDIVRQSIDDLEDQAGFKNVSIEVKAPVTLMVNMDTTLAGILVSNLLKNAIFHNHRDGKVKVEILENTLKVCNTGHGQPLDAGKVFQRFHQAASKPSGTGLGLAIAKAVCILYDFVISYRFEGMHCFEVRFGLK